MFRFVMPDHALPAATRKQLLKEQMGAFLRSDALAEVFDLLGTDRDRIGRDYNGRAGKDGQVLETQVIEPVKTLEPFREKLYPLLDELGFLHINRPLAERHSRVLVLAGACSSSYNSIFSRARCESYFSNSLSPSKRSSSRRKQWRRSGGRN